MDKEIFTKLYREVARASNGAGMSYFFEEAIVKLTPDEIRNELLKLRGGEPTELLLTLGADKLEPESRRDLCMLIIRGQKDIIKDLF